MKYNSSSFNDVCGQPLFRTTEYYYNGRCFSILMPECVLSNGALEMGFQFRKKGKKKLNIKAACTFAHMDIFVDCTSKCISVKESDYIYIYFHFPHSFNCCTISAYFVHGLLILFQRLGWETSVPLVLSECFDVVQVRYDIFKNFDQANFEFLEIHRCPEGVEIGSKQLIFQF